MPNHTSFPNPQAFGVSRPAGTFEKYILHHFRLFQLASGLRRRNLQIADDAEVDGDKAVSRCLFIRQCPN